MYKNNIIDLLGQPVKKNSRTGQYFYNCPFKEHDDKEASFNINTDEGVYFCFGCGRHGHVTKLYTNLTGKKYDDSIKKDIIEGFHRELLGNEKILKKILQKKNIKLYSIKQFKVGWNGERYTFPIRRGNKFINILLYMVEAPQDKPKVIPYKVGAGNFLYNFNNVKRSSKIYIMEGITDTINAIQNNMVATTQLYGAENWETSFNQYFIGKDVVICYDKDSAGKSGSLMVANNLKRIAHSIKIIKFPSGKKGYDFTDYIMEGNRLNDFKKIVDDIDYYYYEQDFTPKELKEYKRIDIREINKNENILKKILFASKVRGKAVTPYLVPKEIIFTCKPLSEKCSDCKMFHMKGEMHVEVLADNADMIELIDCTSKTQKDFLTTKYKIKNKCSLLNIEVKEYAHLEELSLGEVMDFSLETKTNRYLILSGYGINTDLESNQVYDFRGITVPHPRTQQSVQLISEALPGKTSLDTFELSKNDIEELKIFQPKKSIDDKLKDIYRDFTFNITRIWDREDYLLFLDLVYHSIIKFKFQKREVVRGWVEGLAIGDTRTGKTESAQHILNHYKAGEMSMTEKASFSGLIGALQQIGNSWMVTWGKFPMNDLRLYIIDETSGLPLEEIEIMSGVRSSGIAEIIKVHQERTFARTRKIWLSNPRSPYPLNSYNTGIEAIQELIGKPEDIARFDIAITLAEDEVSANVVNKGYPGRVSPTYKSNLCNKLVMWAWTRQTKDVDYTHMAEVKTLEWAFKMSERYSSIIPLVHTSEQRIKLARLSAALAARLFSTQDGETLIVLEEHVDYIGKYLCRMYDKPSMGYNIYSVMKGDILTKEDKKDLIEILVGQEYSKDLLSSLLYSKFIRLSDIENFTGLDRADCKNLLSLMVRKRALISGYNSLYRKTPGFIALIKELLKKGVQDGKLKDRKFESEEF